MKRMLKYLLPLIMAVVFWDCADKPESSVLETALSDLSSMTSACHADISAAPEKSLFEGFQWVFTATHRNEVTELQR